MSAALVMGAIGAASQIAGMISANRDRKKAWAQLQQLQKTPRARYSFDPTLSGIGQGAVNEAANPMGFSGAERAAYMNNAAMGQNAQFSRGTSMAGGSQSRALNSVLGANAIQGMNTFASNDAGLRRTNRTAALNRAMSIAQQRQNMNTMQVNQDLNYRNQMENAYGSAVRSNKDYIRGGMSNLGSELLNAGTMSYMYGNGGAGGFDQGDDEFALGNFRMDPRMSRLSYGFNTRTNGRGQ